LIFRVLESWFFLIKGKGYKNLLKIMSLIEPEREELNPDKDYFSTPRQHHAVLVILCTASNIIFLQWKYTYQRREKQAH
jgi:hypothetical protein